MGLFKRILSLGSKKSKKKTRSQTAQNVQVDEVGCRPQASSDEDTEAAVNLLLRSSSTRYAVVSEMDCTSLPPLPHPINEILNAPSESTTSLESANIARRGTYNVKVHPRAPYTPHKEPEDDLAAPQALLSEADADASQLIRLRRDPSVASLLDLYDEHGHLPAQAFSESPEKQGRAQTKRSGSTLRQLLGGSSKTDLNTTEGDISWAERYLGEGSSAASSMSSLIIQTPNNFDYTLPDTHNHSSHDNGQHDITLSTDHDLSNSYINPTISSMEVEISMDSQRSEPLSGHFETVPYANPDPKTPSRASQIFGFLTERRRSQAPQDCDRSLPDPPSAFSSPSDATHDHPSPGPYRNQDPKTPMRASQIFSFLTERRRSRPPEDCERSLPDLPSVFSSPSDLSTTEDALTSRFSSDHSIEITPTVSHIPATPIPTTTMDTLGHHRSHAISHDPFETSSKPQQRPTSRRSSRAPSPSDNKSVDGGEDRNDTAPAAPQSDVSAELTQARKVKVIMTVPTKVIVTAPTPSNNPEHNRPPMRIPRGPRSVRKRGSSSSLKEKEYRRSLLDRSNSAASAQITDPFTPIISRPLRLQRSPSSTSMNSGDCHYAESRRSEKHKKHKKPTTVGLREALQKENNLCLSAKPEVPFTPIRSNSSRTSLFRTAVTPSSFKPPAGMAPSPASSSELSPVGRQMMMEARNTKHRTKSQVVEKENARRKSSKRHTAVI